tara:strand:+ start:21 stop:449 length:429 start_codon:yes stop_codon:yes gene_type:complete
MYLFVYGVLIRELAKGRAAQLIAPLGPGLSATTNGKLYGVSGKEGGWYPIMLPDPAGPEVHGVVHEASGVDWAGMDDFEDAHDGPDAEYHRRLVPVTPADGTTLQAFAYCYAREVPETAIPIDHGSFSRWLEETGRQPIEVR